MAVVNRRRSERGAATLETVGVAIIAAIVVTSLLLAATPQGRYMGDTMSYWICQVVSAGEGGCTPPTAPVDTHVPTEPCVTNQEGNESTVGGSGLAFTTEAGKRIEVAQMSNGEYKVTISDSATAGVSTGVGGGITVTVDDKKYGGEAEASADASINLTQGDVYYTDKDGLSQLMKALTHDQVKDVIAGGNMLMKFAVDQVSKRAGIGEQMPEPDETFTEGGVSFNAKAVATGGDVHAAAGIYGTKALGSSKNRDGTRTVYLKTTVKGEAGLQSLGFDTKADNKFVNMDLSGEVEVVNAVTFDSSGNMIEVEASVTKTGSASGVVAALFNGSGDDPVDGVTLHRATLPLDSQANKDAANNYLLSVGVQNLNGWTNPLLEAVGVNTNENFFQAAMDRGQVTKQHYDVESNTKFALDASVKYGIEWFGISGSESEDSMDLEDARYWDGTDWVEWEACAA